MVSVYPMYYWLKRFVYCIYWWTADTIQIFCSSEYWISRYSNRLEFRGCIECVDL